VASLQVECVGACCGTAHDNSKSATGQKRRIRSKEVVIKGVALHSSSTRIDSPSHNLYNNRNQGC